MMAECVDAIIVVGPVLWKCVHCDLLISRHHSIDQHLRARHQSSVSSELKHRDSLQDLCQVPHCCCRSLNLKKDKSCSRRKKRRAHAADNDRKNAARLVTSRNSVTSLDCSENEDDRCSDDEIPESLRDLVEQASRAKELSVENVADNAGDVSTEAVDKNSDLSHNDSDSAQAQKIACEQTEQQNIVSMESENLGIVKKISSKCSDNTEDIPSSNLNLKKTQGLNLKRTHDTKEKSDSVEFSKKKVKIGTSSNFEKSSSKETINKITSLVENRDPHEKKSRRKSGRANKGKHSLYNDYEMEIT